MTNQETPQSKRKFALELCKKLLTDLDQERIQASTAVQRLARIAQLIQKKDVIQWTMWELDGYPGVTDLPVQETIRTIQKLVDKGELPKNTDVEATARANMVSLPSYRRLSLKDYGSSGICGVEYAALNRVFWRVTAAGAGRLVVGAPLG